MNYITIKNLEKTYNSGENSTHALKGINITVPEGKLTIITGDSGAGKSTTLNIIGAMDNADSGSCIVGGKEGRASYKVANISEWWGGQENIKLLDPNLLACSEHLELLNQLAETGAYIDITQGLDARLLTEKNISLINELKVKALHFAWDNPRDKSVMSALIKFRQLSKIKNHRKLIVYVLCNYWSNREEDLYRIYWLRDNGFDPYIMVYDKKNAPKAVTKMQRWVNNKRIFNVVKRFEDYDTRIG